MSRRQISFGGSSIKVWDVQISTTTALVPDAGFTPPFISTGQNPGFFTSVSSNGTTAGSAVIWAVNRPFDTMMDVTLYAFDASTGTQLSSATAGTWPTTHNANIVPTVANGKVYVASYKMLSIFGVAGPARPLINESKFVRPAFPAAERAGVNQDFDLALSRLARLMHQQRNQLADMTNTNPDPRYPAPAGP